jgi:hypothetical protein
MTPRQNLRPGHWARARMGRKFNRGVVVLAVGASVLGVAGTAAAYFKTTGTGSGSATAGTAQNLTGLTATASVSSLIYPGGSADLVLKVHNPNSQDVVVSAVAANGSASGCTTPAITVSASTGLPFTVPAGGNLSVTLTGAAAMATSASSDCQGQTITVPLSLTGKTS